MGDLYNQDLNPGSHNCDPTLPLSYLETAMTRTSSHPPLLPVKEYS